MGNNKGQLTRWPGIFKETRRKFREDDTEVESDFSEDWNDILKAIKSQGVDKWTLTLTTERTAGLSAIFTDVKIIKLSTVITFKVAADKQITISKNGLEEYKQEGDSKFTFNFKNNKDLKLQLVKG